MTQEESVPIEELQALVEGMRENAEAREINQTQDLLGAVEQYWAGELEAVIEDYE